MRRAAKILPAGFATLLLLVLAMIVSAMPLQSPSLVTGTALAGLVLGIALPVAAIAVLPWLAIPDASPRGRHFLVALPRLVLGTFGMLAFISVSIMLLLPAIAIMIGAIGDALKQRTWWVVVIGGAPARAVVVAAGDRLAARYPCHPAVAMAPLALAYGDRRWLAYPRSAADRLVIAGGIDDRNQRLPDTRAHHRRPADRSDALAGTTAKLFLNENPFSETSAAHATE